MTRQIAFAGLVMAPGAAMCWCKGNASLREAMAQTSHWLMEQSGTLLRGIHENPDEFIKLNTHRSAKAK
jgi:hypothetical protein